MSALMPQTLHSETIAQPSDDDGANTGQRIAFHQQQIAIVDAEALHRIPPHGEQEEPLRPWYQQAMQVDQRTR